MTSSEDNRTLRPRQAVLGFRMGWLGVVCLLFGIGLAMAFATPEISLSPALGFALGFGVPFGLLGLYVWLYFNSIQYHITERHVSKSAGVIWKRKRSIPFEKITNIDVRQGPFERMMGFGQIWIFTPSTGAIAPEEMLIGINDPHKLKEQIEQRTEDTPSDRPVIGKTDVLPIQSSQELVTLLTEIRDTLGRIEKKL